LRQLKDFFHVIIDSFQLLPDILKMQNIDLKSFLIGFLLASTLLFGIGATKSTQDVRIVAIDKNYLEWDSISVDVK